MESWKPLITQMFGRQSARKWMLAATDIQLVDLGIKPAFLFDHWATSGDELQTFLKIAAERNMIRSQITVINIGLDCVLVNFHSLETYSRDILCKPEYVRVCSTLCEPMLMKDEKQLLDLKLSLQHICSLATQSNEVAAHLDVEITEAVNPPCLFGQLLGYPCVYWYNRSKGEENCLSAVPLCLYQVKGLHRNQPALEGTSDLHHHYSLEHATSEIKESQERTATSVIDEKNHPQLNSKKQYLDLEQHLIYSFTLPANLNGEVGDHIQSWFQGWKENVGWKSLFIDVWLEHKTVEPQAVCL